jgi:hypothetical protein
VRDAGARVPVGRHALADAQDRVGRSATGRGYFPGTPLCLSSLLAAGRYQELLDLLETAPHVWWGDRQWGVRALAALGRVDDAVTYARSSLHQNDGPGAMAKLCEKILLAAGRADEAYRAYAVEANQATSRLATFRAIARKYPDRAKT